MRESVRSTDFVLMVYLSTRAINKTQLLQPLELFNYFKNHWLALQRTLVVCWSNLPYKQASMIQTTESISY